MTSSTSGPGPESEQSEAQAAEERVHHRADELLPEEAAAGSDDPEAQARAILADSDDRTEEQAQSGED